MPSPHPARDGDEMSPLWWSSLAVPLDRGPRLWGQTAAKYRWVGFMFVGSPLPGMARFEAVQLR